ncbi:MAG: hypothetical protein AB7F98_04355 [Novosphingobium sp.]
MTYVIRSRQTSAQEAIGKEDYAANWAEVGDRLRFQIEYVQSALKNLHLVNGGAIVALLTLIGNAKIPFDKRAIWWAFFWFASGLIFALSAYAGAYFSQSYYMEATAKQAWNAQAKAHGTKKRWDFKFSSLMGNAALYSGVFCAVASLVCFVIGAFVALGGIL